MKTRINYLIVILTILASLFSSSTRLRAGNAPTYRGKVVLIVDKTMASDPNVSWGIERLINDLTGDGWRVLRHDVDPGPSTAEAGWELKNAPLVRQVRALIKADYDAATNEVKNVFLLGHVPVPYSGDLYGPGGHFEVQGAHVTDLFYGEMKARYGYGGWSDFLVNNPLEVHDITPWQTFLLPSITNTPGDGKFDQVNAPGPLELGVGRVDLNNMPSFGVNEATLIVRYLNKDHDFRNGNFLVQRRAVTAGGGFADDAKAPFTTVFGSESDFVNQAWNWFPNVSGSGQDYLMGYAFGFGTCFTYCAAGIGTTASSGPWGGDATNNFVDNDSRVVFLNMYGSYFGAWNVADDFLRAPLANPYDPDNGRYGYGLDIVYTGLGTDVNTLTKRALGATTGEALFIGYTNQVEWMGLMGDPTLRLHTLRPPVSVATVKGSNTVAVSWSASADSATNGFQGYNVYSAPTHKGPYILLNTNGPLTGGSFTATRPGSGAIPDNFYMVRSVKAETTPVGTYTNMSEGVIAAVSGPAIAYLQILTGPSDQTFAEHDRAQDPTANSIAFSVDAVGIDTAGNEQVTYRWYKNGAPLTDDCHYSGSVGSALLIKGLEASDAGNFSVLVSNAKTSLTSTSAVLTVDYTTNAPPTVSSIANQQIAQDGTLDVSFTIGDDFTPVDNLVCAVTSADQSLIPNSRLSITGTGSSRVLHVNISGVHKVGTGTVTISVTDDYNATTSVNFQVTVNFNNLLTLTTPLAGTNFQFTITGATNSSLMLFESDDLVTWTSLRSITLVSNSYTFVDTNSGSTTHRFYSAQDTNGCSVNTIGFITVTVPAGSISGTVLYHLVANQLMNPQGNTIDILFAVLTNKSEVQKWITADQGYIAGTKALGSWNTNIALNPGEGAAAHSGGTNLITVPVTFVGDVPLGTQVNTGIPTSGQYAMLSSIIPRAGTLDSLGFPALTGDQILKINSSGQMVTVATRGASSWDTVPTVDFGESFFLMSGSSSNRTWTENFSGCLPQVSMTSPTNGSTFTTPTNVTLTATATAGSGIAQVAFFQGDVFLGVGTLSGGFYTFTWNNPASGVYAITAHATDNNGITTISLPVNITINASWTVTGSMNAARLLFSTTVLTNGKVLVVGGINTSGYLTSAEIYDPATGTWTTTGSFSGARGYHTTTLLPDGKVLLAGGYGNSGDTASCQLYDPTTGTWSATGSLHTPRSGHSATLLPNGKVLVVTGEEVYTAELYDPSTGTWTVTGSPSLARYYHTATLLPNGKVLIAGGVSDVSGILSTAELYDPSAGTWSMTGSLNASRESHTDTLLPNGKVLVAGGDNSGGYISSAELYDPSTGAWTTTGSMATTRTAHIACLLPNGKVLVAGGINGSATAELYNPATGTWSSTVSMNASRYAFGGVLLSNGQILVEGGAILNSAELYY